MLDAAKTTSGDNVPLVTMVSCGIEDADMYLKHPANESSEDEEGTEDTGVDDDDDERKEAASFKQFLAKHKNEQDKKGIGEKPSTSLQ